MNQLTNEEQRSFAKMTPSPVTVSKILEAGSGRLLAEPKALWDN